MTVKNSSGKSGGCGCGGGGGAATAVSAGASSSCSCGGTCGGSCGCDTCATQGFTRPRFFAGQLLTEEDLDLLSDYIVSKNRLRNRTLFGDGVVCGLQVTCNPCGGGTVIVRPGSAIDCCGNDIVVPCEQRLDINAMVRQLRIDALGGYDCGDPCADSKAQGSSTTSTDTVTTAKKTTIPREFCLYLKYCEQLTDPVAAYSTDETCGAQACEPTRVKEGFRFELRCPAPEKVPDTFLARAVKCLGDSEDVMKMVADIHNMQASASAVDQAALAAKSNLVMTFNRDDAKQLTGNIGLLTKWAVPAPASAPAAAAPPVDAATLSDRMQLALQTASLANRFSFADKIDDGVDPAQMKDLVRKSQQLLAVASVNLNSDIQRTVPDSLDRTVALANLQVITVPAEKGPLPPTFQQQLLFQNVSYSVAAQKAQALQLKQIQQKLLDKLDATTDLTNCKLREQLKAVVITAATDDGLTEGQVSQFGGSINVITDVLLGLIANCICLAVNPPCQSCDDTGVLLACLCVEECSVVDICNMSRQFVLAAPAFRYWYPVQAVGKLLELACCGSDCGVPWYATYGAKLADMLGEKTTTEYMKFNVAPTPLLSPTMTSAVPIIGSLFTPKTVDPGAIEHFTRAAIDAADIARLRLGAPATASAFGAGALRGGGVLGQVETAAPSIEDEVNRQVAARLQPLEARLKILETKTPKRGKTGLPTD